MNREEANLDQCIREHIPQAISYLDSDEWLQLFDQPDPSGINNLRIAVSTVIDAINQFADDTNVACSPWVKTSDRLPTEADAGVDEKIVTIYDYGNIRMMGVDHWKSVAMVPGRFPYWLPVPKLPEVEE